MAKVEMKGLDRYTRAISRLERGVREEVCGAAIYEGADVVADAIREGIEGLPTVSGPPGARSPLIGPSRGQKAALAASFGLTKLRDDGGYLNVKAGFDGYNSIKTRRWPKGQPNAMIARSVERGTSFMAANPFIKKAMARVRKAALAAMKKTVDAKIRGLMENNE